MAVALRGNLQDFGIAEVFQLIGQQRKTGLLKVSNDGREVSLSFDAGAVVWATPTAKNENAVLGQRLIRCGYLTSTALSSLHAEAKSSGRPLRALMADAGGISEEDLEAIESLLTRDSIFDVLRWSDGSFDFLSQAISHNRPPEKLLGAEQILMDGLRMVDEWQTFRGSVPPLDSIVEHTGNIEAYRQRTRRESGEHTAQFEKIYQLVDGRLSLQRVIDLSRIGLFDATRIVAEMIEAGLIASLDGQRAKDAERAAVEGSSIGKRVIAALAACVPLLLLGAMVYATSLQGAAQPERLEAFPIVREPLVDAQTLFEKRRIRHAVEAHRFITGDWPADLSELSETQLLSDSEMATQARAAYYYARSEDNVVLLAPER